MNALTSKATGRRPKPRRSGPEAHQIGGSCVGEIPIEGILERPTFFITPADVFLERGPLGIGRHMPSGWAQAAVIAEGKVIVKQPLQGILVRIVGIERKGTRRGGQPKRVFFDDRNRITVSVR